MQLLFSPVNIFNNTKNFFLVLKLSYLSWNY